MKIVVSPFWIKLYSQHLIRKYPEKSTAYKNTSDDDKSSI